MTEYQAEFERQLSVLYSDSRSCAMFAYTQLAFDHIVGGDSDLSQVVNEHAAFWNGVMSGLQTAAFVALGRIFDARNDTDNAGRLLNYAADHLGIFSRDFLAGRKVALGLDPDFAAQYAENAYHPAVGAMQPLIDELVEQRQRYNSNVKPIRHQVFAHSGRLSHAARNDLFSQLTISQFEELVVFPLRLHDALRQLYDNGIEPELREAPVGVADIHSEGLGQGTITWEHRHVVASVTAFMESIRPPESASTSAFLHE